MAFSLSLLKPSNADPLNALVPDLVTTVTAAPPAMPCSASKLLVEMSTVSTVSAGDTYIMWFGSQMFMFVAPSVRVELFVFACPLTLVAIDRPGVSVSALPNDIGIVPGTRLSSAWIVAEPVQRQRGDLAALSCVCTSDLSVCSSGDSPMTSHRLGHRADLQADVDAGDLADASPARCAAPRRGTP